MVMAAGSGIVQAFELFSAAAPEGWRAGIPVYLLIDREEGEVLVYSEPSGDDYAKSLKHKLGLTVPLPAPLGFELVTAEF